MAQDALERLFNSNNQEESTYSVEEQMDSVNDDDFLNGMSSEAEDALFKSVTEVTLDDSEEFSIENDDNITCNEIESNDSDEDLIVSDSSIIEDIKEETTSSKEELFNNNNEESLSKKPRKKRKTKDTSDLSTNEVSLSNSTFNPIMDQLAKDVIDDLRKSKYKISRFDNDTMEIVFNYMYNKF